MKFAGRPVEVGEQAVVGGREPLALVGGRTGDGGRVADAVSTLGHHPEFVDARGK